MEGDAEKLEELRKSLRDRRSEDEKRLEAFIQSTLSDDELDRDRDVIRQLAREARKEATAEEKKAAWWSFFAIEWAGIRLAVLIPTVLILAISGWAISRLYQRQEPPIIHIVKTNAPVFVEPPHIEVPKPNPQMGIPQKEKEPELPKPESKIEVMMKAEVAKPLIAPMAAPSTNRPIPPPPIAEVPSDEIPSTISIDTTTSIFVDLTKEAGISAETSQIVADAVDRLATALGPRMPDGEKRRISSEETMIAQRLTSHCSKILMGASLPNDLTSCRVVFQLRLFFERSRRVGGNADWKITAQVHFDEWTTSFTNPQKQREVFDQSKADSWLNFNVSQGSIR